MADATAAPDMRLPLSAPAALRALGRRLTGPILDKELRVASRRGRTYVLRTAYVLALVGIVALNAGLCFLFLRATVRRLRRSAA